MARKKMYYLCIHSMYECYDIEAEPSEEDIIVRKGQIFTVEEYDNAGFYPISDFFQRVLLYKTQIVELNGVKYLKGDTAAND